MKKLILIIVLAIGLNATSQIELGLYQDVKLAVTKDDAGNTPFTTDLVFTAKMYNGGTRTYNWTHEIFVYPYLEYADLSGGTYLRYAMGLGYTFRLPLNLAISTSFDFGLINRPTKSVTTFSSNGIFEVSYKITPRLKVSALNTIAQRNDLDVMWGGSHWTHSFYGGVTYLIQK
ncbi:MAG: hypothetical protein QM499_01195 [Flavobacteriaceae bacterium]